MNNKKQNSVYSIYGINNCIELLKSKKNQITSIYLLKDGKAYKDANINENLIFFKEKCAIMDKTQFNKKFPILGHKESLLSSNLTWINCCPNFQIQMSHYCFQNQ